MRKTTHFPINELFIIIENNKNKIYNRYGKKTIN